MTPYAYFKIFDEGASANSEVGVSSLDDNSRVDVGSSGLLRTEKKTELTGLNGRECNLALVVIVLVLIGFKEKVDALGIEKMAATKRKLMRAIVPFVLM